MAALIERSDTKRKKVQTVFRVDPELMEKIKYGAKKEHLSVNAYMEKVMSMVTRPIIPQFPKGFTLDPADMIPKVKLRKPKQEELDADPKLAYLWEKYHLDDVAYED